MLGGPMACESTQGSCRLAELAPSSIARHDTEWKLGFIERMMWGYL